MENPLRQHAEKRKKILIKSLKKIWRYKVKNSSDNQNKDNNNKFKENTTDVGIVSKDTLNRDTCHLPQINNKDLGLYIVSQIFFSASLYKLT